jgi:predicted transcriptional regulator
MREVKIPLPEKEDLDEAFLGVLKFFLDSEAKSKIYLYLRRRGASTSREVARGANLYPSSVREALASMTKSGIVTRKKLETGSTGKKPFVYEAISPVELVRSRLSGFETSLNRLFNLDLHLTGEKPINLGKGQFRVRIEKVVDESGEEKVLIDSSNEDENTEKKEPEDSKEN